MTKAVLHMQTTGFLLNSKRNKTLAEARLSIRFSIHAGRPATYRKIMGKDFDVVMERIAELIKAASRTSKENDFWFSYVLMKENEDEIEDFLHTAKSCGVGSVRFMKLKPTRETLVGQKIERGGKTEIFKYKDQYDADLERRFRRRLPGYLELAESLGLRVEVGTLDRIAADTLSWRYLINAATQKYFRTQVLPVVPRKGICAAPWLGQLSVKQNGDVTACCASSYRVGNLHHSSLAEIWNSDRMKALRKPLRRGHIPRSCGYCVGFGVENYPRNSFRGIQREEVVVEPPSFRGTAARHEAREARRLP